MQVEVKVKVIPPQPLELVDPKHIAKIIVVEIEGREQELGIILPFEDNVYVFACIGRAIHPEAAQKMITEFAYDHAPKIQEQI